MEELFIESLSDAILQAKCVKKFVIHERKVNIIPDVYNQSASPPFPTFRNFLLNSLQIVAITEALHSSAIITAPTSAGKTLVGAFLIDTFYKQQKRSFFTVPSRALASEVHEFLTSIFGTVGYNCGDKKINSNALIQVLTYEKFDILTQKTNIEKALIIIDEFHFIGLEGRGYVIERLLANKNNQFLCLSATLKNAKEIAAWIGFKLLQFDEKHRKFHVKTEFCKSLNLSEKLIQNSNQNFSTIIFVRNRQKVIDLAIEYAQKFPKITLIQPPQNNILKRTLAHQVGFHSASLNSSDRKIVENLFRNNAIKLLFATTTLAYGVNLHADNVIIYDSLHFTQSDLLQMSGRAGRDRDGEAIIVGETREIVIEVAESQFLDDILRSAIIFRNQGFNLIEGIKNSLFCYQNKLNDQQLNELIINIEQLLQKYEFVGQNGLTRLGKCVIRLYQSPKLIIQLSNLMKQYQHNMSGLIQIATISMPKYSILSDNQMQEFADIISLISTTYHSKIGVLFKLAKTNIRFETFEQEKQVFIEEWNRILNLIFEICIINKNGYWGNLACQELCQIEEETDNILLKNDDIQLHSDIVRAIQQNKIDDLNERQQNLVRLCQEMYKFAFDVQIQPIHDNQFRITIHMTNYKNIKYMIFGYDILINDIIPSARTVIEFQCDIQQNPSIFLLIYQGCNRQLMGFNMFEYFIPVNKSEKSYKFQNIQQLTTLLQTLDIQGKNIFILSDNLKQEDKIQISKTLGIVDQKILFNLDLDINYKTELSLQKQQYQLIYGRNISNSDSLFIFQNSIIFQDSDSSIFTLESILDLRFQQIFQDNMETNIEEFMQMLSESFLIQRYQENPSFYQLQILNNYLFQQNYKYTVTEDQISTHLTQLIESILEQFQFDGEIIIYKQ
ncbi:DEAD/DEAH box helicase domain-containing protein [Spironucleus salmonicida]|uniref:DEAD/DEAH box helicase domain-containing protein n=1 Tax=Spironucleus salmonicida TaxID=348837 RepID=V6LK04_9EUKA|nr:DEAD/DEAH box helicase domain-containing protein [Spironucleus salmonicida]|eukprot:EST44950.1 DEAD/DEAH box helicase domain-containing protein [Spironucleus salmonicida]